MDEIKPLNIKITVTEIPEPSAEEVAHIREIWTEYVRESGPVQEIRAFHSVKDR